MSNRNVVCYCSLLIITVFAFVIRVHDLPLRPMHTDESVQAVKFGMLLENNYYRYNSEEYHGPTLYYATLIPAWLTPSDSLKNVAESTLRIVPVFAGVLLILAIAGIATELSLPATIAAALLTAISPAMVFFSRYYIQEMLLVFFAFAAIVTGVRYFRSRRAGWAVSTGIFLGLAHATKETSIVMFAAMAIAIAGTLALHHGRAAPVIKSLRGINWRDVILMILAAVGISAIFYSSFFQNPIGIADSYLSYLHYFEKAGQHNWHEHPWYYYLQILFLPNGMSGILWGESSIVLLAIAGFVVIMCGKGISGGNLGFLRFIALYTLSLSVIYSAIPYKTPWIAAGILSGLILLAAAGMAALINLRRNKFCRLALVILIAIGLAHLLAQTYLLNFKYYADPVNPYVYAHTSKDIFKVVDRIEKVSAAHPDGKNMYIEVICSDNDYWPLPWYLRAYSNVGWWDRVDISNPAAPVIIASPDMEPDIIRKLYEIPPPGAKNLYVPLFDSYTELRPHVELRGYIVQELWNAYLQSQ